MGRLALVPLILFAAIAWLGHRSVEQSRMDVVAAAVVGRGHTGPVEVTPMRGTNAGGPARTSPGLPPGRGLGLRRGPAAKCA